MVRLCILLLFFGFTASLRAEVIYTDIDPDHTQSKHLSRYLIDIDNNGKPDFATWLFVPVMSGTMHMVSLGKNEVAGSIQKGLIVPELKKEKIMIGPESKWVIGDQRFAPFSSERAEGKSGGVEEGYVGLRLSINGEWIYGWLRVQINAEEDSFTMLEYALETQAGKGILAGDKGNPIIRARKAGRTLISYKADAQKAGDLHYDFLPADDESTVDHYRLMIFPIDIHEIPSPEVLLSLPSSSSYRILPGKPVQSGKLPPGFKDIEGNAIDPYMAYMAVIVSIPKGKANFPGFSELSNAIQFWAPEPEPQVVAQATPVEATNTAENQGLPPLGEASPPPPEERDYPKVKAKDYKLYSAGKKIFLKTTIQDIAPGSAIAILPEAGRQVLIQAPITDSDFVLDLEQFPAGVYQVRVNLNGTLISRPIFIR